MHNRVQACSFVCARTHNQHTRTQSHTSTCTHTHTHARARARPHAPDVHTDKHTHLCPEDTQGYTIAVPVCTNITPYVAHTVRCDGGWGSRCGYLWARGTIVALSVPSLLRALQCKNSTGVEQKSREQKESRAVSTKLEAGSKLQDEEKKSKRTLSVKYSLSELFDSPASLLMRLTSP